jgi:hypothetical protein
VIDQRTYAVLERIIRRESLSFLLYAADSFPWITKDEGPALAKLQQIIAEQRPSIGDVVRFLVRNRLELPYLGSYPVSYTTSNFVALDWLLPRLVQEERKSISALEKDLGELSDGSARVLVQMMLERKRRHLEMLEGLAASGAPAAAAG